MLHRASRSIAFASGLFGLCAWAPAADVRVPQDHPTIQAAIDAAAPGDVVLVSKGTYQEDLSIVSKTNLTLQAKGKVTLKPSGTGVFIDQCTGIRVTGLSVEGGATAFDIDNSTDVTIEKFRIKNVGFDGVFAESSSDVKILDGKIDGCEHDGISFADEKPLEPVLDSEIARVKISNCQNKGIDVLGQNVKVSFCSAKNIKEDGFASDAEGLGPVTFESCKVLRAVEEGFEVNSPGTKLVACKATRSGDDGFDVEASDCRLEDCKATRSFQQGFQSSDTNNLVLLRCKAVRSGDNGFEMLSVTNARIEACQAVTSRDDGYYLGPGSTGNTLIGNKASKSEEFGLDDESGGVNTFTDNKFGSEDPNN